MNDFETWRRSLGVARFPLDLLAFVVGALFGTSEERYRREESGDDHA